MHKTQPSDNNEFSLMLGGPLYQLYLRTGMAGPPLTLLPRRLFFFPLLTWIPPFLFSLHDGTLIHGVEVPFLHDITVHARFLVALPLLLFAELFAHQIMKPIADQFIARGLIAPDDQPRYKSIMASAMRLRNSALIEILLLILCFTAGHQLWLSVSSIKTTWYSMPGPNGPQLTPAGLWYGWISMPVFQFIFFRWLYRILIWIRFLWQISRLKLRLLVTHPDRAGGLGFLDASVAAFSPIVMAQGAVIAGLMAGRIFFEGATLASFKMEVVSLVLFQLLIVLGPLCIFFKQLSEARRKGLRKYGELATHYMEAFDRKWTAGQAGVGDKILGSGDIQSLADMGNSFRTAAEMRSFPFGQKEILQVVVATLLPICPLILTVVPLEQLISKLLGIPF